MSFSSNDLSVLAYANGFTLWHYKTDDAAAEVDTQGYFDAASDVVRAGDMILANTDAAGAAAAGIFLVSATGADGVDVADLVAVGASNSD